MSRLVGQNPHPCGLIQGFDEKGTKLIQREFAASKVISSLDDIEEKEWDALVTTQDMGPDDGDSLFILTFGTKLARPAPGRGAKLNRGLSRSRQTPAKQFVIPDGLSPAVLDLVDRILVPSLQSNPTNWVIYMNVDPDEAPKAVRPFVALKDGFALAGEYPRPGGAWVWALPWVPKPAACVRAALVDWNRRDPRRFPLKNWIESETWATFEEGRVLATAAAIGKERARILADFDARQKDVEDQLATARAAAEAGSRRLLTTQGPELVDAVAKSFREVGFDVRDMDRIHPAGDLREDLRVTHKSRPAWLALVEVRGYKGGAAVNDLLRISRWVTRYVQETGKTPTARWYVVNQLLGRDPAERQPVLAPKSWRACDLLR